MTEERTNLSGLKVHRDRSRAKIDKQQLAKPGKKICWLNTLKIWKNHKQRQLASRLRAISPCRTVNNKMGQSV